MLIKLNKLIDFQIKFQINDLIQCKKENNIIKKCLKINNNRKFNRRALLIVIYNNKIKFSIIRITK